MNKKLFITEEKGSYSIEAALLVPIFIFMFILFVYILQIMCVRITVNNKLYGAVSELSIYESQNQHVSKNHITKICNKLKCDDISGVNGKIVFDGYINDNNINISSKYKYSIPLMNFNVIKYDIAQRCYLKAFTGNENLKENSQIVFITKKGKVYHNFSDCTYLRMIITKNKYKELLDSNKKYSACKYCIKKEIKEEDCVYTTEYGNAFHILDSCSYIYRDITSIPLSKVNGMTQCKKCKNRIN